MSKPFARRVHDDTRTTIEAALGTGLLVHPFVGANPPARSPARWHVRLSASRKDTESPAFVRSGRVGRPF